jgi:hypothetical protein
LSKLPHFSPDEILGNTFVRTLADEKTYLVTVVRISQDHDAKNHANIKLLVELGEKAFE